jgi:cation diffusion facilitator CzcD-associated flavoprotein CzcO
VVLEPLPGLACDIESYVYLPLLEELGYLPVEKYSRGRRSSRTARRSRSVRPVSRRVLPDLGHEIRWDADASRWTVFTIAATRSARASSALERVPSQAEAAGHSRARDVRRPRVPHLPLGLRLHGGDANGNLTNLRDKRVGIIGTGATAVQCVPPPGRVGGHLYVFQRTPSSIGVRANRPTDPEVGARARARLAAEADRQLPDRHRAAVLRAKTS